MNISSTKYKIIGQKINETQFCEPPLSLPVTVSGSCGQNVPINVQFQSNDPILMTGGTLTGDVTCSQKSPSRDSYKWPPTFLYSKFKRRIIKS